MVALGDYSAQSDTGSILHLKWVPSSCFQEINIHSPVANKNVDQTTSVLTYDDLNLEENACSWRQMRWVLGEK